MCFREAEQKFWWTPEFLEILLTFLDPASILALAEIHPLTTKVMQGGRNWTRFIKRSCPHQATISLPLQPFKNFVQLVFNYLRPILFVF